MLKLLNYFNFVLLLFISVLVSGFRMKTSELIELSVIHLNDFHARFEETNLDSGLCKSSTCIGGFPRLYNSIVNLKATKPQSILLNSGDNFEGTLWYDVHGWNITQYFFNKLPFDAFTLGNHEFEDGIAGLIPFLHSLRAPVVVANIDGSKEPEIQNLIKKSIVVERNGLKIGIIGVVLATIDVFNGQKWERILEWLRSGVKIAKIGNLILLNESESINAEADRLVREENVFTNIILSHCGYDVEKKLASNSTSRISLIVGGHTHSFLYTGEHVPGTDLPMGPYPTVVKNPEGKTVLVVQASSYSKYLGNITIFYNRNGDVLDWSGAPIFMGSEVSQDEKIKEELIPWKKTVDEHEDNRIIGKTIVRLEQSSCPMAECLIGNFITDAMVYAYIESPEPGTWTNASISIIHSGSLRSGIDIGNVSYNEIINVSPFNNTIDLGEIQGQHLKKILEFSTTNNSISLLQVSGLRVVYNLTNPEGLRVTSLQVRCRHCTIPIYEDLVEERIYRIVVPSFLAEGGFGFNLIQKYLKNRKIGGIDRDLFVKYLEGKSPIFQEIQGRIIIQR